MKIDICEDPVLEMDWLRGNCKSIHYFGLGFIQLKIDRRSRIHFYTPELPPTTPEEDIHNHRYNFRSTILKGSLHQECFRIKEGGYSHIREFESCREGVCSVHPPSFCDVERIFASTHAAGTSYSIDHEVFHRVSAEECITRIDRGDYAKEFAEVIRPSGERKVCPFAKKVPEDRLWSIIESMI